ncbi:PspC domain-containing protein [Glutamicibacter ardleyensis]|uniref:PspC domain-containing protein n=1 Tax=Glutamicibacter ardleyensis TaxID=225894 RepID=UPI003FB766F5
MNNEHPSPSNIFERLRGAGINRQDSQWLGGVAAGIATRLNVDVVLVRGVFVALSLLAGFGLIIYAIAWALLADTSGKIHLEQAIVNKEWAAALTGASIFLGVGIFVAPWLLSTVAPVLWPVLVIAGIAFVIFSRRNSKFAGSKAPHSEDHKTKTPATDTTSAPHPRTGSVIEVPWRDPGESSFSVSATMPTAADSATTSFATTRQQQPKFEEKPVEPDTYGAGQEPRHTPPHEDPPFGKPAKKLRNAPPIPGWVSTVILGVTVLAVALILSLDYLKMVDLPGNGWSVALASGLFLVGLSMVFAALSNRTSGGLLGLAIPLLVLTVVFSGSDFRPGNNGIYQSADKDSEYSAVFSSSTVDLRGLNNITAPKTVEIDSVFSKLDIALPANVPVQIETNGLFLSNDGAQLPQDNMNFPADAPVLTVKIDGVFSSFDTSISTPGLTETKTDF